MGHMIEGCMIPPDTLRKALTIYSQIAYARSEYKEETYLIPMA